jgi:hypothetical protein
MSEELKQDVEEAVVEQAVEQPQAQPEPKTEQIDIDVATGFTLKLQEFDKKIAEAKLVVAQLEKEKSAYIYDQNVQQIVFAHKERILKAQIEEEAKKKLAAG